MGPESLTTFIFNPRFDNDLTVISRLTAMTKKMGHRATRFEDLVQTEVRAISWNISAFSGRRVASSSSFCYDNFSPITGVRCEWTGNLIPRGHAMAGQQ
jgi:hypothetical protein